MGGDEDSSDSGSVGSVLEEVLREKGKTVSLSVRQRLRSASRVLRDQSSSDAAALLCDAEAIDSVVTTQDSGNFPDWLIELAVQLLTVLAVCLLACAGGIIVGTVMSRGTLSTGGHVVGVHKYGNATLGFEFFEPKTKRTSASSPAMDEDVTALLRGQFVLKLPAYSSNAYIEALSGLVTLTYVPAVHLPSEDACFGDLENIDKKWSFALQPLTEEEAERRKLLLRRGRENFSLIRQLKVESVNSSTNADTGGVAREALTQEMKKSLLYRDSRMIALLTFSQQDIAPDTAINPLPLVSTPLPFVAGIVPGLTRLHFYVGVNLPLTAQDALVADSLKNDCRLGRLYVHLSVVGAAATSMFFRQPHLPVRASPFPVQCFLKEDSENWPPPEEPSFKNEAEVHKIDSEILFAQDVQTA